ncbi:MAG TPA: fatty acyl-AMP ligase, partial [Thermoanaerobaculia bacterium]|nr:fatty acyl-AMP ligase [Thermoanaerobaculia bacterium]
MNEAQSFTDLVDLLRRRARQPAGLPAYTFLRDGEVEEEALSFAALDERARAVAAALQGVAAPGERALLLFPAGLDFVAAFFGCLYAGVVAVPAYPPGGRRPQPRLRAIARDAEVKVVVTTAALAERRAEVAALVPEVGAAAWVAVDALPVDLAELWTETSPGPDALAFLQYTSGSTSDPKGVRVTHGNLLHNEELIRQAFGQSAESVIVGWLPLYHDMGLIGNVLQPLYVGARCVLMSPLAFLQQPARWLRAVSRYRATTSGGPNFAYDLCVRKVQPGLVEELDLSSWRLAFNGAEPVRAATLARFAETFGPCGFRREAFYPCYGLAEATLFVSGGEPGRGARAAEFGAEALAGHRAAAPRQGEAARELVGCGAGWGGQRIVIADPESGAVCGPEGVGEIWLAGPRVAAGYWNRSEETERAFGARLVGGEGPFLRTGDFGFVGAGGELFVTGRLKDLLILRGRNVYPQDLELTAEDSHPGLRPGSSAAFAVEVEGEERAVLVCELDRRAEEWGSGAGDAVRRAV